MPAPGVTRRPGLPVPCVQGVQFGARRELARQISEALKPSERLLIELIKPREAQDAAPGVPPHPPWPASEWEHLNSVMQSTGLFARMAQRVKLLRTAAIPEGMIQCWQGLRLQRAVQNLLLLKEEVSLLHALHEQGMGAIPIKGVSLARILHADPAARFCSDLDLMVRAGDVARAGAVLEQHGYTTRMPRALLRLPFFLQSADEHTSEVVYVKRASDARPLVELHWRPLALPEETMWQTLGSYETEPGSASIRTLGPEVYLLLLCGHVSGHGWAGLRWLCDAADFLARFSDRIDAGRFVSLCGQAGLRHRAGVTLLLVEAYFGMHWPAAEPLLGFRAERDARKFLRRPLAGHAPVDLAEIHLERLRLQDSTTRRLQYLAWLLGPTHTEFTESRPVGEAAEAPIRSAGKARVLRWWRLAGMVSPARVFRLLRPQDAGRGISAAHTGRGDQVP